MSSITSEPLDVDRHDLLTGLPNRSAMDERLQGLLDRRANVSVVMIGFDGLKKINDDLGHKAGDSVLKSLAIRMPALAKGDSPFMARLEGPRFAMVLPGIGDPLRASSVAADLLDMINRPSSVGDHAVKLSGSAGLAIGPAQGKTAEDLVSNAMLALQSGGGLEGKISLFEPAMRAVVAARRAMNEEIVHAVEGMELELHFQPQFDLTSNAIVGAEALLRWNHSQRGQLAPPAFLAALEAHSLAAEVGDWILDEACRQVASWRRTHLPSAHVAVNLFAGQLQAGNLVEVVRASLRRHDLPPEALELEMAERTVFDGGSRVDEQLQALRAAKVRLAIDNFGAGHGSLSLLKRLPLSTLKIDRSLVGNMLRDKFSGAAVAALLGMAGRLGLDVVAEGIETERQGARLVEAGCRFGQGYYLAKPMAAKRFMQYCRRGRRAAKAA